MISTIIRLKPKEQSHTGLESPRQPAFRFEIGSGRRARLFGVGWFLEWPGGQRPLNSTWPWSGVKLSILVLWGVCWMFYMRIGCWQQGQPYAMHNHSHPQSCLRKAPRPPAIYSSPTGVKNSLPFGKQRCLFLLLLPAQKYVFAAGAQIFSSARKSSSSGNDLEPLEPIQINLRPILLCLLEKFKISTVQHSKAILTSCLYCGTLLNIPIHILLFTGMHF